MVDMTVTEFYDALYYGADIEMSCGKWFYRISSGYVSMSPYQHNITVYKMDKPDWEDEIGEIYEKVFDCNAGDAKECIDIFMNATIFDGKKFAEVVDDISIHCS